MNCPPASIECAVAYRGPFDEARKLVGNRWAGHQVADAWTGEVESREVDLRIAEDPLFEPATLSWGDPIDGLSAAVEFLAKRSATDPIHRPVTEKSAVPLGSKVQVRLHIKNVSHKTITFWSETWRQDDRVIVNDGSGEQRDLPQTWYSGWSSMIHWTLQPGQVAKLDAIQLGVAADEESAREFDHPIGPKIIGPAGFYAVRYTLRFGGMQRKDAKGIVIIPGPGDWTGTLTTDWTPLKVRERTPKDERPTFTARLQFRSAEQKVIKTGKVTVRLQSRGTGLFEGEVQSGLLTVGQCPYDEPLIVQVRSPGFEETSFYDVAVQANEITSLTVPKADPVGFRLVSRAGQPVVGAKVRLFNRSKKAASVGPYPMKGLKGPVWGTSDEHGIVVLDMLQLIDPNDSKLGNNIYFFYIEPLKRAPRFLGPLEAGDQPGDLEIGPWLEARGEIRGTEEELKNFAAEWDQSEPMVRGDGTVGWYYAQSKRLETTRVGDKLTFHLKNLRPGRLRIVSNFRADTKSTRHVYSRREPTEGDVVFDVNLQNSRNDLVVTNRFVREE